MNTKPSEQKIASCSNSNLLAFAVRRRMHGLPQDEAATIHFTLLSSLL